MSEQPNGAADPDLREYLALLGGELSSYREFVAETGTLEEFASSYGGGEALLAAAEKTDSALRAPVTATVGYDDAAAASGVADRFLTLNRDDADDPEIRFEDDVETVRSRAGPSWLFGVKQSPTTVVGRSVSFRVHFGVPEDGATRLETERLDHLRLQLPPVSRLRSIHGRERYVVQSRLTAAEWAARNGNADGRSEVLRRQLSALDGVLESL